MAKPRGVKFQHRANGHENRRPSIPTISSESATESEREDNPIKNSDIKENALPPGEKQQNELSEYEKKKATFITRAIWSLAMIAVFFGSMFAGHIYVLMIITAIQIICFKEVINIAQVPTKQKNLPLTKSLNWYFLAITMYFLYGESVIYYFKHILLVDKVLLPFATHHRFISFMMYILGKAIPASVVLVLTPWSRVRFLCRITPERPLSFPIYAVCVDTYGALPDRRAGTLHDEQRF